MMTNKHVEILSDDEGTKGQDDISEEGNLLVYKHKDGIVELHSTSLECLQTGSYLKDDVVQFYFTYLVNEVCTPAIAKRVHIFDSIFYNQIFTAFGHDEEKEELQEEEKEVEEKKDEGKKEEEEKDGDKKEENNQNGEAEEPKNDGEEEQKKEKQIDEKKVKQLSKWHNGIDLFSKDFLIFPICSEDHWIVVIVCYPTAVKSFNPKIRLADEANISDNTLIPGIVIMDSLISKSPKKVKMSMAIRDFLDYNWRSSSRPVKRFSHSDLADYFPRLPKQTNHFDCGLYMIMYVKCFLEDPDAFYNSIRDERSIRIEPLSSKIKQALEENDRDTIKALINKVCS